MQNLKVGVFNAFAGERGIYYKILVATFFIMMAAVYSAFLTPEPNYYLVVASMFGAYMALNIGANDVANNVGPAVGAKAISIGVAIIIAIIFEAGGALIAGGDVVTTIKKGIIDISAFDNDPKLFVWAMSSALLAAAFWLNLATSRGWPVSTTHSIVGGVMGAGIAASGFGVVSWFTMGKIAASWIISPLLGGVIAAAILYGIKVKIINQNDKIAAAVKWIPFSAAFMALVFVMYLTLKGLKKIWHNFVDFLPFLPEKPNLVVAFIFGFIIAVFIYIYYKRYINSKIDTLENNRESVNKLFNPLLAFSAALLCFAHGANDVANAIGPLAAIYDAIATEGVGAKVGIPFWIMVIGALGISAGLAFFGPKLIKKVGSGITELDQVRAYSIAMAAAITVIIASQLGLPVSSTHIAIGGIFGVGLLREHLDHQARIKKFGAHILKGLDTGKYEKIVSEKRNTVKKEKEKLKTLNRKLSEVSPSKKERKRLKQNTSNELHSEESALLLALQLKVSKQNTIYNEEKKALEAIEKKVFVKRSEAKKIVMAWIITVPSAAVIAFFIFYIFAGVSTVVVANPNFSFF